MTVPTVQVYTLQEVAQHKTPEDLWMVIHGQIYDISAFREEVRR